MNFKIQVKLGSQRSSPTDGPSERQDLISLQIRKGALLLWLGYSFKITSHLVESLWDRLHCESQEIR